VLFGVIWALAALGITFNAIDLKKYAKFSMACYLLMGWAIVVRIDLIYKLITPAGFWLLLTGGIEHIRRLIKMLTGGNGLKRRTLALYIGSYIATLSGSSLYLNDSVIEFYIGTKHSL
jgi:hypothetical protein